MPRARPTLVASGNGASALPTGMRILRRGGSALDAVEACARIVEEDPTDTSVGRGGKPNVLGIVELDASIVDGTTHRVGAVAALVGYLYPITIARAGVLAALDARREWTNTWAPSGRVLRGGPDLATRAYASDDPRGVGFRVVHSMTGR